MSFQKNDRVIVTYTDKPNPTKNVYKGYTGKIDRSYGGDRFWVCLDVDPLKPKLFFLEQLLRY